jgi:Kinesin motor domain
MWSNMTQYNIILYRLLEVATKARATGTTAMNATSSRSHAICTFTLHVTTADPLGSPLGPAGCAGPGTSTSSKFHLVDLAGSERIKKTKAVGGRLREGISINKSLLALGTSMPHILSLPILPLTIPPSLLSL